MAAILASYVSDEETEERLKAIAAHLTTKQSSTRKSKVSKSEVIRILAARFPLPARPLEQPVTAEATEE